MSYTEKHENISKDDWMNRLEGLHIQRSDMNKLIMNYLVTDPAVLKIAQDMYTREAVWGLGLEAHRVHLIYLDYFLFKGFKEAAEKFQQESGVQPSIELDSLDDRIRIRDAIQSGRIEEATALVNQLHPELLDNDRYLYFHLQVQLHLIELIRIGRVEESLHFAQEHLSEAGESDPAVLQEIERTLALLAFDEPHNSPYSDLLHPTHRQKVASELNAAILKIENREPTTPKLSSLLKLILWAQDELDKKKIKYPKMTSLADAVIESPK